MQSFFQNQNKTNSLKLIQTFMSSWKKKNPLNKSDWGDCFRDTKILENHIKEKNLNFYKPFPKQAMVFMCLHYKTFENTVGKGEIARD